MKISIKKNLSFPVIIEKDESGFFVGVVPSLQSCYTQAKSLPELYKRLQEVVALSLEIEKKLFKTTTRTNQLLFTQMKFWELVF